MDDQELDPSVLHLIEQLKPRPRYAYELTPTKDGGHARYDIVDYHQDVNHRVLATYARLESARRVVEALNKYEFHNAHPPGTFAREPMGSRPGDTQVP